MKLKLKSRIGKLKVSFGKSTFYSTIFDPTLVAWFISGKFVRYRRLASTFNALKLFPRGSP